MCLWHRLQVFPSYEFTFQVSPIIFFFFVSKLFRNFTFFHSPGSVFSSSALLSFCITFTFHFTEKQTRLKIKRRSRCMKRFKQQDFVESYRFATFSLWIISKLIWRNKKLITKRSAAMAQWNCLHLPSWVRILSTQSTLYSDKFMLYLYLHWENNNYKQKEAGSGQFL